MTTRVLWGRVIAGGVAAEVLVFAVVFPVLHFFGQTAFLASILVASLVLPLLFGMWVARRAGVDFVLHGFLVGVVAAVVYLIVSWGRPEPLLYVVAHGLKVVGGALGGMVAARGRSPQ